VVIPTILSQYETTYGTSELFFFRFSGKKTSKIFNLTSTGTFTEKMLVIHTHTNIINYIYIYIYTHTHTHTKHRRRWEDNIKMDLQEVGWGRGVAWTGLI